MLKEQQGLQKAPVHGSRWWDHESATAEGKWTAGRGPGRLKAPYKDMQGTGVFGPPRKYANETQPGFELGETHVITNQLPSYKWKEVNRSTGKPEALWQKQLKPEPYERVTVKEQQDIMRRERQTGEVYDPATGVWK
jgi:hypothetical protein